MHLTIKRVQWEFIIFKCGSLITFVSCHELLLINYGFSSLTNIYLFLINGSAVDSIVPLDISLMLCLFAEDNLCEPFEQVFILGLG